jgi:hypothetical protein
MLVRSGTHQSRPSTIAECVHNPALIPVILTVGRVLSPRQCRRDQGLPGGASAGVIQSGACSRITNTGQWAWWTVCADTEPSIRPVNPP